MSPETLTLERGAEAAHPAARRSAPRRTARRSRRSTAATAPTSRRAPTPARCDSEEKLFTITLDEALAIFAQPKQRGRARRGRAAQGARAPTRSPRAQVTVREGRFGPYVTDGETNASLRKGDDVETITIERAAELLADRRAAGPAKKKKAAKKAPAKKAAGQEGAGQEGRREEGRGRGGAGPGRR